MYCTVLPLSAFRAPEQRQARRRRAALQFPFVLHTPPPHWPPRQVWHHTCQNMPKYAKICLCRPPPVQVILWFCWLSIAAFGVAYFEVRSLPLRPPGTLHAHTFSLRPCTPCVFSSTFRGGFSGPGARPRRPPPLRWRMRAPQVACWEITSQRQANRIRRLYLAALVRQDIAFFDEKAAHPTRAAPGLAPSPHGPLSGAARLLCSGLVRLKLRLNPCAIATGSEGSGARAGLGFKVYGLGFKTRPPASSDASHGTGPTTAPDRGSGTLPPPAGGPACTLATIALPLGGRSGASACCINGWTNRMRHVAQHDRPSRSPIRTRACC